jgi:hypothetical protein
MRESICLKQQQHPVHVIGRPLFCDLLRIDAEGKRELENGKILDRLAFAAT